MALNLKGRSFLSLKDFSREEILYLLNLADDLKRKKRSGGQERLLSGKNIVIIFEKTSTRTRCSFEVAAYDEGAGVTFLTNSQMGKKESIEDTAKVLGRLYDGIEFRGYQQKTVDDLARFAGVPVWNGLTDLYHPTQILADFMTARESLDKPLDKMKFAFLGDGRFNMANSFLIGCAVTGADISIVSPAGLQPDESIKSLAESLARSSGSRIQITDSVDKGVDGADVLYTDVWFSMGEEDKMDERIQQLRSYQVNSDVVRKTGNPDVIFMHCLPAFHDAETEIGRKVKEQYGLDGMEVSDEVFRSPRSVVFEEAENRMHTIKAVMCATIGCNT